ncbi:MAG TPA: PH domain-containing protein [Gemmatimonadales bacterium]|nr:PH domain-containing protein [Gemmatimonadales bacterium]
MSYVDQHLMPGERVVYRARQHWIIFAWPGGLLVLALGWMIAAGQIPAIERYWPLAAFPGALGLFLGVAPLVKYLTSEYAVTDRRVIIKVGLLQRRSLETLLGKIEAIGVEQGLLDRLIDRGTITITGTGGTREAFANVSNPLEFRRQVQARIAALERGGAASPALVATGAGYAAEPRQERECPWCAERILVRARICRFCGRDVTVTGEM